MSNYKDKSENEGKEEPKIPDEFSKVIKDLIRDIKETFPEVVPLINKWWKESSDFEYIDNEVERTKAFEESQQSSIKFLFSFCQKKFPPRFFEILYQNDEMFKVDSDIDTEFLPHIHFKNLWQFDITQKTRDTIWKYLQLILFSIVGSLENRDAFGDSAKLFEAINQDDFKNKLEETLSQMQGLFDIPMPSSTNNENATNSNDDDNENNNSSKGMPNADDIHEHINGMLDGQLGKLAKEIAEETAANLNIDMENVTDMKDVFSNLVKNPTKLMGLVKSVGDKLDSRIKSGEIKESELISEATDIMNKMKNMPGMENIQSMLGKMGIPGLGGKNAKMNMGAMEAQMNKNMKTAQMRERMKAKLEAANLAKAQAQTPLKQGEPLTDEQIFSVFSTGEKVERTPRGAKPEPTPTKGKKKKGKK
jgi:hypothetical protein